MIRTSAVPQARSLSLVYRLGAIAPLRCSVFNMCCVTYRSFRKFGHSSLDAIRQSEFKMLITWWRCSNCTKIPQEQTALQQRINQAKLVSRRQAISSWQPVNQRRGHKLTEKHPPSNLWPENSWTTALADPCFSSSTIRSRLQNCLPNKGCDKNLRQGKARLHTCKYITIGFAAINTRGFSHNVICTLRGVHWFYNIEVLQESATTIVIAEKTKHVREHLTAGGFYMFSFLITISNNVLSTEWRWGAIDVWTCQYCIWKNRRQNKLSREGIECRRHSRYPCEKETGRQGCQDI